METKPKKYRLLSYEQRLAIIENPKKALADLSPHFNKYQLWKRITNARFHKKKLLLVRKIRDDYLRGMTTHQLRKKYGMNCCRIVANDRSYYSTEYAKQLKAYNKSRAKAKMGRR